MKQINVKTAVLVLLVACMTMLSACSKKDKEHLLSTIPAETAGVMIVDVNTLWNQLEIKAEDGDVSYCSELKEIFNLAGLDKKKMKNLKKAISAIDQTSKYFAIFEYDKEVWVTFYVEDGDDFIEFLEDEGEDIEFEKDNGYQVAENDGFTIAVKGDQVWGSDKLDTETIDKFRDLDKEDRFDKKYEKITKELIADDNFISYFVDIKTAVGYLGKSDAAEFNMALSMVFKDANYVLGINKLNDNGYSTEVRILDDKEESAEFLLPMATIDDSQLTALNGNAPLIIAGAIDPKLTAKIFDLVEKLDGPFSQSDMEAVNLFKSISGSFGASFASLEDAAAVINFDNASTPSVVATMLNTMVGNMPVDLSTSGNSLVARLKGSNAAGQGSIPSVLKGQYLGIYLDMAKEQNKFISGYDFSGFGKLWITLGPDGKGVKLSSNWELKNPVRSLLKEGIAVFKAIMNGTQIEVKGVDEFERKYMNSYSDDYYYAAQDSLAASPDDYYYNDYYAEAAEAAPADDYYK